MEGRIVTLRRLVLYNAGKTVFIFKEEKI